MKNFLQQSYYLWVAVRIILIVLCIINLLTLNLHEELMNPIFFARDVLSVIYMAAMLVLVFHEFRGTPLPFLTRSFVGGMSLIQIFWLMLFGVVTGKLYYYFFAVIMLLFGLFDVYVIKKEA